MKKIIMFMVSSVMLVSTMAFSASFKDTFVNTANDLYKSDEVKTGMKVSYGITSLEMFREKDDQNMIGMKYYYNIKDALKMLEEGSSNYDYIDSVSSSLITEYCTTKLLSRLNEFGFKKTVNMYFYDNSGNFMDAMYFDEKVCAGGW